MAATNYTPPTPGYFQNTVTPAKTPTAAVLTPQNQVNPSIPSGNDTGVTDTSVSQAAPGSTTTATGGIAPPTSTTQDSDTGTGADPNNAYLPPTSPATPPATTPTNPFTFLTPPAGQTATTPAPATGGVAGVGGIQGVTNIPSFTATKGADGTITNTVPAGTDPLSALSAYLSLNPGNPQAAIDAYNAQFPNALAPAYESGSNTIGLNNGTYLVAPHTGDNNTDSWQTVTRGDESGSGQSASDLAAQFPQFLQQYLQGFQQSPLPTTPLSVYQSNPNLLTGQGTADQQQQLQLLQQVLSNPNAVSPQDLAIEDEQGKSQAVALQQAGLQQLGDQMAGLGRYGSGYQLGQTQRAQDLTSQNILNTYQTNQLNADNANFASRLSALTGGTNVLNGVLGQNQAQAAENLTGVNSQNAAIQYALQTALSQAGLNNTQIQEAIQAALGQSGLGLNFAQLFQNNAQFNAGQTNAATAAF